MPTFAIRMIMTSNKSFNRLCVFLFVSILLQPCKLSHAQESGYPFKLDVIDKSQAKYDTPENTLAAKISALLIKDLAWFYETLTRESAALGKKLFQEAGIDPAKNFEMVDETDQFFIINKIPYKTGIVLVGKIVSKDGSILIGPAVFVKEDGLWKQTTEFNTDEELDKYRDVITDE
jgi:hypothetical protein